MTACVCGARAKYDHSCLRCLTRRPSHGDYAASSQLWSHKVETHYHPPAGLFTKGAEHIARVLLHDAASPGQAIRRLQFYINRAGRNLSGEVQSRLHHALRILERKL